MLNMYRGLLLAAMILISVGLTAATYSVTPVQVEGMREGVTNSSLLGVAAVVTTVISLGIAIGRENELMNI